MPPKLPAVAGLVKHQVYMREPWTGREQNVVQTFWTWKNENPVPQARITSEVGAIIAWAKGGLMTPKLPPPVEYTWVKSWDMGQTPPARFAPTRIWPRAAGTAGSNWVSPLTVVVALRTQAVGSEVRNRLNGRLHHRYPSLGNVADGQWSSGFRGQIETLYHALRDVLKPAAQADRGTWVVPCWFEDNALRPGGPLLPAVNHCVARNLPGVVKSTQVKPGPYARGA